MQATLTHASIPLAYIPVRHSCGHFEARFMRWNGDAAAFERGYVAAGSKCTTCAPQGRPVGQQFATLDAVRQHCDAENARKNRDGYILSADAPPRRPATAPAGTTPGEVWYAPGVRPQLDWMSVGARHVGDEVGKARILAAIADIDRGDTGPGEWSRWLRVPGEGEPPLRIGFMPGEAIKSAIRQFKMPRVTHIGISAHCSPLGFYGIRAHYRKADKSLHRIELFVMDEGDRLTPIVARVWP